MECECDGTGQFSDGNEKGDLRQDRPLIVGTLKVEAGSVDYPDTCLRLSVSEHGDFNGRVWHADPRIFECLVND